MANNRVAWLDIAKGMAIILMVLGHTSIPAVASNFIYAFHMPLFFIASGWVTRWDKHALPQFITHRLRTLMLPFGIYSAIVLIISTLNRGGESCRLVVEWLGRLCLMVYPCIVRGFSRSQNSDECSIVVS